jgi:hypothetical protein
VLGKYSPREYSADLPTVVVRSRPDIRDGDLALAQSMLRAANRGWYIGDMASLRMYGQTRDVTGRTEPELGIRLLLSKDKMHHSVGWWRNAEYEYCWHLSISAWGKEHLMVPGRSPGGRDPEDVPEAEERYWTFAFFPEDYDKLWHEPGGTDPRLTPEEKMRHRHFVHLRLFLDPETFEPFIPRGEVYDLTRWIPGLTPEKVDR